MRSSIPKVISVCFLVGAIAFAQDSASQSPNRDEILKKLAEQRELKRKLIEKALGPKFSPLMACSIAELQAALKLKVRDDLDGSIVMSAEDPPVFLGSIQDWFQADSIFNSVGAHGSTIGAESIWNDIGRYGSSISMVSAFNSISMNAPYIVRNRAVIGRLSTNEILQGAVDPRLLRLAYDERP